MDATQLEEQDRSTEVESIEQVVAALQHAQQNELVEEFVGLFRADAIWTTAHGKRLTGRDEISEFTAKVLPGAMAGLTPSYEVVHVLFIRPDVAAVKVRQRYFTGDGAPVTEQPEGTPLYVLAKEEGRWRLVAGQNTQVLSS
ncbi:SgcJ/EcaC family oxidoreductase [Amycolatopsis palatopharyngis]|uniref:SgcJ/EcaC family oxidoreductase n=1 Tax=Amycolatopsis palatopharyngis TaxID=187982 RepID=UPI000E24F2E2|nr:SgcJ/EcaC family oxidoreductase [Amycolatopsis palatopharyngis]